MCVCTRVHACALVRASVQTKKKDGARFSGEHHTASQKPQLLPSSGPNKASPAPLTISAFQGLPLFLCPESTTWPGARPPGLCLQEGPAKAPDLLANPVDFLAILFGMGPILSLSGKAVWKG